MRGTIRVPKKQDKHNKPNKPRRESDQFANKAGEGWSSKASDGIVILQAGVLSEFTWLAHGFSTRRGGKSRLGTNKRSDRNSSLVLNLGATTWDSRAAADQNRGLLQKALRAERLSLQTLNQIHSDLIYVFTGRFAGTGKSAPKGDSSITGRAGLLLAVQAADCVPILLADTKRRVVAAVHAGWRGTLARIVEKTLGRMRLEFGTEPGDVAAAVGPSIGRCCYEVGPEVAQAFAAQFPQAEEWFDGPFARLALGEEPNPLPWLTMMPPGHEPPPERVNLDLRAANRSQLLAAGVRPGSVAISTLCTSCRADLFFSYRREGASTGRMMAVIGVLEDS